MSTSPAPRIAPEILMMIFESITEEMATGNPYSDSRNEPRPLNTVRSSSQVCRHWRSTLLGSSWIWGRVVDMDTPIYRPRRGQWMEEVVRRAGSARLWISGRVTTTLPTSSSVFNTLPFFIRLLQSWDRIEKLSVTMSGFTISKDIQDCFLSPAPVLKHFEIDVSEFENYAGEKLFHETLEPNSGKALFANHAPLLKTMNTDYVVFKLDSPWLAGIREMVPIPLWLSIKDLFVVLRHTPMIQKIRLDRSSSSATYDPALIHSISQLNLPNLTSITLVATLPDVVQVLDHVTPSTKLSNLTIKVIGLRSGLFAQNPELTPSWKESLRLYISNYFTADEPSDVQLRFTQNAYAFFDVSVAGIDWAKPSGFRRDEGLNVLIKADGVVSAKDESDANQAMTLMLDAIADASSHVPGLFDSVNEMTLDLSHAPRATFSNIRLMLAAFRRIRIIRVSESLVGNLCSVLFPHQLTGVGCGGSAGDDSGQSLDSGHSPVLFPELHTVYLTLIDFNKYGAAIVEFLSRRKQMGYPVARLDITRSGQPYDDIPTQFRILEDFEGLEVVAWTVEGQVYDRRFPWDGATISRYICGSGGLVKLKQVDE